MPHSSSTIYKEMGKEMGVGGLMQKFMIGSTPPPPPSFP